MEGVFASEGITKSDRSLHTPSSFAKTNLLYVQEVGRLQSLTPHVCKRNNIDSYLIFEVVKGKGSILYENHRIELRKGQCVWIDCQNEFEHISSENEPWHLTWVHFNGNGTSEFYRLFREKNKSIHFAVADSALVEDIIYKIHKSVKENAPEMKMHGLLTQLIVNCILLKTDKNVLNELREYINVNYREQDIAQVIRERFGYQAGEAEELFERSYGIDIRDYVTNRRFNAAKELLRFTIQPINKVIDESGIRDKDAFYKLFQENENMSPEEYRRRWAQWIKD